MKLLSKDLFYNELDAKDFLRNYTKNSAVSISGGKDSLVALDLSYRIGIRKFVFSNTSLNYPGTEQYIKELERYYDIDIIQVKPPRDFLDIVKDIGFPSRRLRWCCEVYKFGPLANYVTKNKIKYLITGIRSEESRKRQEYTKVSRNPLIPTIQLSPILDWTTKQVWEYIKFYKLPYHYLYDKGYNRLGCWMCPFQGKKGFERLKNIFPSLSNALKNSLYENIIKFGRVGVRDVNNYIKEYAWTKNALPIRNILKGFIEHKKDGDINRFTINCLEELDFKKLLYNLDLIRSISEQIIIDEKELIINIKSNKFDLKKIEIYCEKQVNCIGCGACRSLCVNSAIEVKNKFMTIDFLKCNSCLSCLTTTKMRAGCIARNYLPIRKKFGLISLNEDYINLKRAFSKNKNIGLIKTRKKLSEVQVKLEHFFKIQFKEPPKVLRVNGISIYSTQQFTINLKRELGYTTVYLDCTDKNIENNLNILLCSLKSNR